MRTDPRTSRNEGLVPISIPHRPFAKKPSALSVALLGGLFLLLCGCDAEKEKKAPTAPNKPTEQTPWPQPKVAWKTSVEGRLWPLARIGDLSILVISKGEGRVGIPNRVGAVRITNGEALWETKPLLAPSLVRKTSPWSFSYAAMQKGNKKVFAYLRREGKVTALDASSGERLWTKHSKHGVAPHKDRMVLSDGVHLDLVDPVTGKRELRLDLAKTELGAGAHGLKQGLAESTILQLLGEVLLLTRRDGSELQALSPKEKKLKWRLDEPQTLGRRLLWLPHTDEVLLAPTGYPNPRHFTKLVAWPRDLSSKNPIWKKELRGQGAKDRLWVLPESLMVQLEGVAGRHRLTALAPKSGKLQTQNAVPSVESCHTSQGTRLVCRLNHFVLAFTPTKRRPLWQQKVGRRGDPLYRVWTVGPFTVAVTANRIWVLDTKGDVVWKKKKTHGGHRYIVRDLAGRNGGRLLFLVEKHLMVKGVKKKEVVSLIAMNEKTGKDGYSVDLGPPSPSRRKRRVGRGWKELHIPLRYFPEKDVLFSGIGGHFRLVRGRDGAVIKDYTQPGPKDTQAALLGVHGETAYVERGDWVIAVTMPTASIIWRKRLPEKEVTCFGDKEVFWKSRTRGVGHISPTGTPRLDKLLAENLGTHRDREVVYATPRRLLAKKDERLVLMDRSTGQELAQFESDMEVFEREGLLLGLENIKRSAKKTGVYLALNKATGKPLWRKEVSFESNANALPAPVLGEKRWPVSWVRAAEGLFMTTDTMGHCVVALSSRNGKRLWSACFDDLTGPPIVARGYLFITAKGLQKRTFSTPDKAGKMGERIPKGGSLFAIRLRDGKSRQLLKSEKGRQLMIGHIPPTSDGRLLMVDAPVKSVTTDNRLLGVDLW